VSWISVYVFAEVDKRIADQKTQPEFITTEEFNQMLEQKATTKYMVFVEGRSSPKKVHDSYDSAEKEAKRLSAKEIGCNVFVVEIIKAFKSRVIVEEVKLKIKPFQHSYIDIIFCTVHSLP
jgi:hypothetical protein